MSIDSDMTMLRMAARVDPVLRDALSRVDAEIARLREQADALAAALESLVAECDKSIRWRDTRGMRTATDLSAFAATSYSGVLETRRVLQAALENSHLAMEKHGGQP